MSDSLHHLSVYTHFPSSLSRANLRHIRGQMTDAGAPQICCNKEVSQIAMLYLQHRSVRWPRHARARAEGKYPSTSHSYADFISVKLVRKTRSTNIEIHKKCLLLQEYSMTEQNTWNNLCLFKKFHMKVEWRVHVAMQLCSSSYQQLMARTHR